MATEIRFHLDEHVDPAIAIGLRTQGIDVTTTGDAALLGADDTEHMAYALAEGRVILTHDDDFLREARAGTAHAGICFCHRNKLSLGEILQSLILVHGVYSAEEMAGRVEWL
jgi:predicted nuclease of predicted toxin-antitoxin system